MLGRKKKDDEEEEFGFGDVDTSSLGATADDRKRHPACMLDALTQRCGVWVTDLICAAGA